ncbi:hypothetical protein GGR56DRAFT_686205 [Xylariaceae sp. FL0804]|nr:hypothetical protein GGR56DRAFT_686205 [Xylariaceae sp. FL0804]
MASDGWDTTAVDPIDPMNTRLSYGIELEFLVAYLPSSAPDPDASMAKALPPLLRIDAPSTFEAEHRARLHIREALDDLGLRVSHPQVRSLGFEHLVAHRRETLCCWDVGTDLSVRDRACNNGTTGAGGYMWAGVELRSPASWDEPRAYDEVRQVLHALRGRYRLRVNPTCGFHVHVGIGQALFDGRTIGRAAAFLWAADPLLSRLHAPWRRVAEHSASVRLDSKLAVGDSPFLLMPRPFKTPALDQLWSDPPRPVEGQPSSKAPREQYGQPTRSRGPFESVDTSSKTREFLHSVADYGWTWSDAQDRWVQEDTHDLEKGVGPRSSGSHGKLGMNDMKSAIEVILDVIDSKSSIKPSSDSASNNVVNSKIGSGSGTSVRPGSDSGNNNGTSCPPKSTERMAAAIKQILDVIDSKSNLESSSVASSSVASSSVASSSDGNSSTIRAGSDSGSSNGTSCPPESAERGLGMPAAIKKILDVIDSKSSLASSSDGSSSIIRAGSDSASNSSTSLPPKATEDIFQEPAAAAASGPRTTTTTPAGRGSSRQQQQQPRLAPHDPSTLPQSYRDRISAQTSVRRKDWARIAHLPRPEWTRNPRGEPATTAVRHGLAALAAAAASHPRSNMDGAFDGGAGGAGAVARQLCVREDREFPHQDRLNYDFHAYEDYCWLSASSAAAGGGRSSMPLRTTLEFREAGGSLDPEWVVAWARACVGILRWCRGASIEEFRRVLGRVVAAQEDQDEDEEQEQYDVCDLLDDLGLEAEADFVRRRERLFGPPR